MSGEDKRRFERATMSIEAHCRPYGALSEVWRSILCLDISAGGMSFQTDGTFFLEDGADIEISRGRPGSRAPIFLRARVMRATQTPAGLVDYGVEFFNVVPDQQADLDELVHFLKRQRKPPASST
jgi:c-di-GMP-binding flagellar brake protein YcgR